MSEHIKSEISAFLTGGLTESNLGQFAADMRAVAKDPETQRWWKETAPCQIPLPTRKSGAKWSDLEMVFLME